MHIRIIGYLYILDADSTVGDLTKRITRASLPVLFFDDVFADKI